MKENKMGTMPINGLIISVSLPIIISMLVQALYNIVDSIFVAMISENALTAVSQAFPIQNLMIAVGAGTGVGMNALLSKSLGEKNQKVVDKTANMGVFLALCSYIVFALLGALTSGAFYRVQNSVDEIINYGQEYMFVVTVFSFGIFGQLVTERTLQATGKTIYTMITQGTGAIINIVLDPILIFGLFGMPRMGVTGAAVATVIGQIIATGMGIFFNLKVNKEINFSIKSIFKPQASIIEKIYEVGIPSIIMQSISSVLTFGMNMILISFTKTAVAVFGVYFKLNSFLFMPVFGLNNGLIPILGYNYGAKKPDRIKKTIKLGMIYAVSIMAVGFVIFQVIPNELLLMFHASAEMLSIGVPALRIISISFVFAGLSIVCSTVFQAIGNPIHSLIMSVSRQLIVLLPVAFLLSLTGRLELIWWAFPIAEIASVILCVIFMKKTIRKIN